MKELIESVIFAIALLGAGTYTLREVHDTIRKAALEKVSQGLPPLTKLNQNLKRTK
jgi:hypothetical protein